MQDSLNCNVQFNSVYAIFSAWFDFYLAVFIFLKVAEKERTTTTTTGTTYKQLNFYVEFSSICNALHTNLDSLQD